MISNPCKWFGAGGNYDDQEAFTYEGGARLYHFDCSGPRDKVRTGWTDNWIPVNVVFFANSEEHARDVFKRMLKFRIETLIKHSKRITDNPSRANAVRYLRDTDSWYHRCRQWLRDIDDAIFTLAPMDQFYEVGWAYNTTILN